MRNNPISKYIHYCNFGTCSCSREAPEEAVFGVAGGHGAFPYVAGPGMKLSGRGGRPSEAGADSGMGRSTIAGALLRPRPKQQAAGWLTE